jgi:hypothetical protein
MAYDCLLLGPIECMADSGREQLGCACGLSLHCIQQAADGAKL